MREIEYDPVKQYRSLAPVHQEQPYTTGDNPLREAGHHPVPQERETLLAVLRATESTMVEFPYLSYRFGHRGRRFGDSDGGWLVTMADLGAVLMEEQVEWLGSVCASRGLPRLLLARHLELLAKELTLLADIPREHCLLLQQAGGRLRRMIDEKIPPSRRRQQRQVLSQSLGLAPDDYACYELIELLASALVDDDHGLEGASHSLLSWFTDGRRFSPTWTRAVRTVRFDRGDVGPAGFSHGSAPYFQGK
ncbi:MAG: hypothetical protein U5J62_04115 [Desulfurivibrio sp.]|nr:hypothetical protein [Desulfurivibrio sp.]